MTSDIYKYHCYRCDKIFELNRLLDTDRPVCNECFEKLLKVKNYNDYLRFTEGKTYNTKGGAAPSNKATYDK